MQELAGRNRRFIGIGPADIGADDVAEFVDFNAESVRLNIKDAVKAGGRVHPAVPDLPELTGISSGDSLKIGLPGAHKGIKVKKRQLKRQGYSAIIIYPLAGLILSPTAGIAQGGSGNFVKAVISNGMAKIKRALQYLVAGVVVFYLREDFGFAEDPAGAFLG